VLGLNTHIIRKHQGVHNHVSHSAFRPGRGYQNSEFIKVDTLTVNRHRLRTHPCLTPLAIVRGSERYAPRFTGMVWFLYQLTSSLTVHIDTWP